MEPLVSLICPCYENEKTIVSLVESLDKQDASFPFEVIFVDDPSHGKTLGKLKELAATRAYMKIIAHEERVGVMASRIDGIKEAKGKYIGFCDADDFLSHRFLSTMVVKLEEEKADAINCSFYIVDSEGHRNGYPFYCLRKKMNRLQACKALLNDVGMRGFLWTKMIKASILKSQDLPILPGRHGFEDLPYVFAAFSKCDKVIAIQDKLYYYVKSGEDTLTERKYPNRAKEHLDSFAIVRAFADNDPSLRKVVISSYLRFKMSLDYDLSRSKEDGLSKLEASAIRKAMKNLKSKGDFSVSGEIYESVVKQSLQR